MNMQTDKLEFITKARPDRPNRMCVVISDLHLTDGSVGFQNLDDDTWKEFYAGIRQRCLTYNINELVLVLNGDIVDMIRSGKWAAQGVYPWMTDQEEKISEIINAIIQDIIRHKHPGFFAWLRDLEKKLIADHTKVKKVKIVTTLGNHDKELFRDNQALTCFYAEGLGIQLQDIDEERRRMLGRMYGDETMFLDKTIAPYWPFYYGDSGFRFFATHGQWRDADNCVAMPGWSVADGWSPAKWQALKFAPFIKPCFGDSVAAGVLSTFIYKTKIALNQQGPIDPEIETVLDELDLYRPTYGAVQRIVKLTAVKRRQPGNVEASKTIEHYLTACVMDWLKWDFTLQASSSSRKAVLIGVKWLLTFIQLFSETFNLKVLAGLLKLWSLFDQPSKPPCFKEMQTFPGFLPIYRKHNFQIHGEGHTHIPLQGEANIPAEKFRSTYINFGTWRDQIVPRDMRGYRRRSVLRALYILDLENYTDNKDRYPRTFDYFVVDATHWGDLQDQLDDRNKRPPRF